MTFVTHAPANVAEFRVRVAGQPADKLRVTAFEGVEGLCELFEFRISICSEDATLDPQEMLGLEAVLEIEGEHGVRRVCGIIRRFERTGSGPRWTHYAACLVPPHWLLTRRVRSRVFNERRCRRTDVPGIVAQVLADAGLSEDDLTIATARTYEPREYTVQYRESDWDFISRLLEEEGIYWFFEHEGDRPRLVLMDSKDLHRPFVEPDCDVPFRDLNGLIEEHEFVFRIGTADEVQIGAAALDDFDFRQPAAELLQRVRAGRFTALELSDFPGDFRETARGQRLAQTRLEEHQCRGRAISMGATVRSFLPGRRFRLVEHADARLNDEYLIAAITHRARQPQSGDEEAGEVGAGFDVEVCAIPADVQFRPPRCTPRPTVLGSQTAIVVGPPGEEIHTDEYGRVEVRFHWDREGAHDVGASCWIRVSQGWAGGQYGMMFLPRVGQEVIVDFLEGDPDRPIITGRVYNGDHMPPYKLPDRRTISTIRTCSSPGAQGGNEIRFDDARGGEQLLLFAQNALHVRSRGSRFESVAGSAHETVTGDAYELVKKSKHAAIELDLIEEVRGSKHLSVAGDVKQFIDGKLTTFVQGQHNLLNSDGIWLGSDTSVTLWCKGNFIKIDSAGVTIVGNMVNINSGGAAHVAEPDAPRVPDPPQPADTIEFGHNTRYSAETVAADGGEPDETDQQSSWIEIELVDDFGRPVPHEPYEIVTSRGEILAGTLDAKGHARVLLPEPGQCQISFPRLDTTVWERA